MTADRLTQANIRLKPLKIQLIQRGDRLSVRGNLPRKEGHGKAQQTIALGLSATPAGINRAEKIAAKIASDRDLGVFSWADYLPSTPQIPPHQEAIDKFKAHYLAKGGRSDTWASEYQRFLGRLNGLSESHFLDVVATTAPNTRTRKKCVVALNALAQFLSLKIDIREFRGNYSPYRALTERSLPDDARIESIYAIIPNTHWQWAFGMMATYGLRNHEVFRMDLSEWPIVLVREGTKTGGREVFPCPRRWLDLWELGSPKPPPLNPQRSNQALGQAVTRQFERYALPIRPYDLRHAWAIRTLDRGWPVEISSQSMGHSTEVHTKIYQRWITREAKRKIYDRLTSD